MEVIQLYFAILMVSVISAGLFAHFVKDVWVKQRVGAWAMIVVGASFLTIYAVNFDRDAFGLILGVSCIAGGIVALRSGGLNRPTSAAP